MKTPQVDDVIEAFMKENRRVPSAKELSEKTAGDLSMSQSAGHRVRYMKKNVKTLTIIGGKVYDAEGRIVWYQATAGSMMPAAFYPDAGVGQFISR